MPPALCTKDLSVERAGFPRAVIIMVGNLLNALGCEGYMQGWINTKWDGWMDESGKMNEKEDDLCEGGGGRKDV